jgi:hypothetical protein
MSNMIPSRARTEVTVALSDDPVRLSQLLEVALSALREEDFARADEAWARFDEALRNHIEFEEQEALPFLERSYPDEVAALALEHTRMLALLDKLGAGQPSVGSRRHVLMADLSAQLRAHAEREGQLLQQYLAASAPGPQAA